MNNYMIKPYNDKWLVGVYLRLSSDDKDKDVNNSLLHQERIIRNYLTDDDSYEIVDVYTDDGYTGTNFKRPGFIRMIDDIKANNINCVVVKDLSRLGREYLEVGYYLEKFFPEYGIRFISIMQDLDNFKNPQRMTSIEIPFLSLLNEQYAIDISKKTRASLKAKCKAGKYMGVHVPYGYKRSPNDKHKTYYG